MNQSFLSGASLNILFEAMPDALVIVNQNGEIIETNLQAEKLFGYNREELIGKPVEMLVPSKSRIVHEKYRMQFSSNPVARFMGTRVSLIAAHKNGNTIPVDISLNPMNIASNQFVVAAIRDISEIIKAYEDAITGWSRAMDFRDRETEKHTKRVAEMAVMLAEEIGLSAARISQIRQGSLLHDIGKLGIPDSILLKPGKLTDEEWTIMRKHPEYAVEMLWPINFLRPATLDIPYCHHEKWDGTGYPRGLKGDEIPIAARVFAVVDVWDALSFDRPYRKAWAQTDVKAYLKEQSGKHFDPEIVEVFFRIFPQMIKACYDNLDLNS